MNIFRLLFSSWPDPESEPEPYYRPESIGHIRSNNMVIDMEEVMLASPTTVYSGDTLKVTWKDEVQLEHECEGYWTWDRVIMAKTTEGDRWFISDGSAVAPLVLVEA